MTKPSIEEILGKDLYEQVKAKIGDYEIAVKLKAEAGVK